MNLLDSLRVVFALFDAHLARDRPRRSKHGGSKRHPGSKALCRERRKRQRQARRRQRMFAA